MNLVIDDAVEVRLPTKNQEESRKNLGTYNSPHLAFAKLMFL
jgi:hypothetical protein